MGSNRRWFRTGGIGVAIGLLTVLVAGGAIDLRQTANGQDVRSSRRQAESASSRDHSPPGAAATSDTVATLEMPALDVDALLEEDITRAEQGLPLRFAVAHRQRIDLTQQGTWQTIDGDLLLLRYRISAPNAVSINLGFARYRMPADGQMIISAADGASRIRAFTDADNKPHGQLWTPPVNGRELLIKVTIPRDTRHRLELELGSINLGYRKLGSGGGTQTGGERSGSCNVDVVCPQGALWSDEIATVAMYTLEGIELCTGFMVNNVQQDRRPLFMTAAHCGVSASTAPSLVTFWNFHNSTCRAPGSGASGGNGNGSLDKFITGATHLVSYFTSDFTLVELDSDPHPSWDVHYAGWDGRDFDASSAVCVHHPNNDEKRISFENDPVQSTACQTACGSLIVSSGGDHVLVNDWDMGTTEPGSSGAPLFDGATHRVIGQLHGGFAACGNDDYDSYGKFAYSWHRAGANASNSLKPWLDPQDTGAQFINTVDGGLGVWPSADVWHEGQIGGSFTNDNMEYTLSHSQDGSVQYQARLGEGTLPLLINGDTTAVNGSVNVGRGDTILNITLAPITNLLPTGVYERIIEIEDVTNGFVRTVRHVLAIGDPITAASFPLNVDPGWTTTGQWAFGDPAGIAADPDAGHTGANVYGYNLNGEYPNDLPARALTSKVINCSSLAGVEVSFWRWLGVESGAYDGAAFQVSNDGATYHTIWSNPFFTLFETSWTKHTYDISAIADGQPTVYLRWVMGPTDYSYTYAGWNIDDIEVSGFATVDICDGDANFDGLTNVADLLMVINNWGSNGASGGDVNLDGIVNVADLLAVINNWGVIC